MQKIILTAIIAFFFASFYFIGTIAAFSYSDHPMLGLLMRFVLLAAICYSIVMRKRENFVYAFLLSFPFLSITFNGISIFMIFAIILTAVFFKSIMLYIYEKRDCFVNPWFLLLATAIFTTFIATYKWEAINQVFFLIGLFLVYITLKIILSSDLERKRIFVILNIILSFALLIAVLQIIFGVDKIKLVFDNYFSNVSQMGYISRVPSFFGDAQEAGIFFAVMSFLALGLAVTYFKKNLWIKSNFLLSVLILFFNGTRIAIISLIGTLLFVSLIKPNVKRMMIVALAFFIGCSIFLLSYSYLPAQFSQRVNQYEVNESLSFRLKVWKSCWPLIKDNFLGVGLGRENAYAAAIKSKVNPYITFPTSIPGRYTTHFENTYLEILYSLGIVGFLCFIYILFRFFVITYKSASTPNRKQADGIEKYLFGCMLIWAISVFSSPEFSYPRSMTIFILILAFVDMPGIKNEKIV